MSDSRLGVEYEKKINANLNKSRLVHKMVLTAASKCFNYQKGGEMTEETILCIKREAQYIHNKGILNH